jgi:hypothetical protein
MQTSSKFNPQESILSTVSAKEPQKNQQRKKLPSEEVLDRTSNGKNALDLCESNFFSQSISSTVKATEVNVVSITTQVKRFSQPLRFIQRKMSLCPQILQVLQDLKRLRNSLSQRLCGRIKDGSTNATAATGEPDTPLQVKSSGNRSRLATWALFLILLSRCSLSFLCL